MTRFDITDLDAFLSTDCALAAVQDSLASFKSVDGRKWIESALAHADGDAALADWSRRQDYAGAFASHMEKGASGSTSSYRARGLMESATMIRVLAGGGALAGKPFDWAPYEGSTGYFVDSPGGTRWDIAPRGRSATDWGITIAGWDYPDYFTRDLDRAMCVAEQMGARPPYPMEACVWEPNLDMDD